MISNEQENKIYVGLNLRSRVMLVIVLFVILPLAAVIYLYETQLVEPGKNMLFVLPFLMLVMIFPIVSLFEMIIFNKPMIRIIEFCIKLKEGNYSVNFNLPNQKDDEPLFVNMLRELQSVANHIRVTNRDFVSAVRDTKDTAEKMKNLAIKDALTELYNRRYFDAMILDEITRAHNHNNWLTLLMLDCDKFKKINDNLGHSEGDNTLRLLADTIRGSVRTSRDIPFRFGGDEFGVILPSADVNAAIVVARRIQEKYRVSKNLGTSLSISITSAKFRCVKDLDNVMSNIINVTDKGLYKVKESGGDDISVNVIRE